MSAFSPIGSRFLSFSGSFGASGPLAGLSLKTRVAASPKPIERQAPTVSPEIAALREALRSASDELRISSASLSASTRTGKVTTRVYVPGVAAVRRGVLSTLGTISTLATTREVNRQTSTIRISGSSLGLDVTSPETASSIRSSAALGLDVTSPETASTIQSSAALGLDVTSPETASTIQSSAALGLDVTSPETTSTIQSSAALGLDVTSPEAASTIQSSTALGLDVTSPEAVSTLTSTAEANTAPTSYGAVQLTFVKNTTAQTSLGNLSGVYSGTGLAVNATSLELKISSPDTSISATVPVLVQIKVTDQNKSNLGTFSGLVTAGQKISLGSDVGLDISFTVGTIIRSAEATFTVSRTTPTNVDPNAVFNAANVNLRPRFENGAQVVAGSFTVNGTSVQVLANDTITSVLARINSTVAGISASFSGDKVTLVTTASSEDDIVLAGDTSGFLAALKLTGATTVKGNVRDDVQVLSKATQFSSVANGSFTVNGVAISVNRTTDTLQSVISRINASAAGVTALYDSVTDKVRLTTTANAEDDILFTEGGTGFVAAAKLDSAVTSRGNIFDDVQVLKKTSQFGSVASGSFTVNGVSISVNRDTDTLQSVIARINASAAGVTALYDEDADRIRLTTIENTEDDIVVTDGGTGFVAAAKLDTAVTSRGNIFDDAQILKKTSQFGSVASGAFTVNGVSISIDRDTDTLQSVIARINASAAGLTAIYDADADRIRLTTTANTEDDIVFTEGGTGFIAAARLDDAETARGNIFDDAQVLKKTSQFGSVASGSFTVNGVSISVDRDTDTLQSVISRINESSAGVIASYDAEADRIVLTTDANTEDDIVFTEGGTGFVAAAKLDTAVTSRGNIYDDVQVLKKTAQFGSVASGSFTVNGVSISVDRDADTLQTVVARINASGAGVSASYDAEADRIVLTTDANTEDEIVFADGGTGFVAAARLDDAVTERGNIRDDVQALAKTSQFSSVATGGFSVNGVSISVDRDADTLQMVIARINASGAGVTASYDAETDRVSIAPDVAGTTLVVDGDTSGFLSAIDVFSGPSGINVNPTARFDATGANAPLFEDGVTVGPGSFLVNGKTILVAASDTLSSVLEKITASGANVTAAFDASTEKITLTAKAAGNLPITLSGDSSGFLAAVGFDGTASLTPGVLRYDSPLSGHAVFAGVTAGSIMVNGTAVAVDPDADSLQDVLASLNAIAGVRASLDTETGAVVLRSLAPGGNLEISDGTGLLSIVGIETGTVEGRSSRVKSVETAIEKKLLSDPGVARSVSGAVAAAAEALNKIFSSADVSVAYKSVLADAVRAATEKTEAAWKSGVEFVERGSAFEFKIDAETLAEALVEDPEMLETFLGGANALPTSIDVVETAISDFVVAGIGAAGGFGLDSTLTVRELGNALSSSSLVAKLSLFSAAGTVGPKTGAFYDRTV